MLIKTKQEDFTLKNHFLKELGQAYGYQQDAHGNYSLPVFYNKHDPGQVVFYKLLFTNPTKFDQQTVQNLADFFRSFPLKTDEPRLMQFIYFTKVCADKHLDWEIE